jgi:AcrR family transcriptional regulator
MKPLRPSLDATRRGILDALAHVIVESKGFGFSVQEVADRAGVTHRTVYNHFPTRDALSEGLSAHVDELFSAMGPAPERNAPLRAFPEVVGDLYRGLATEDVHVRAYVLLTLANRRPTKGARARMRRFAETVERDAAPPPGLTTRELTAVIRMFVSSLGWHTLTEQLGLSLDEASRAATWATRTLIAAVEPPPPRPKKTKENAHGRRTRHE